jgi:hypothetical protein
MFMIVPGWDVYANLANNDNRSMASFVKFHVSDADLEGMIRTLRNNGYTEIKLERTTPASDFVQTVED